MMIDIEPTKEWIWGALVFCTSCTLWFLGDKRYVRRGRYHDAVNTLTANTSAMQVDIQNLKTSVAVMSQAIETMSRAIEDATEHYKKMAESTAKIEVNMAKLTGTWEAAWWLKHGAPPQWVDRPQGMPE